MPLASSDAFQSPARLLLYGPPKTGKTWFACKAAEAGFNVILLDGDNGSQIISNIPMKARQKIAVVKLFDTPKESVFHNFIISLSRGKLFAWNEDTNNIVFAKQATQFRPENNHVVINPSALTPNDVLVIDSWSSFCRSMELYYKLQNNIKILEALKKDWDDYHWAKRLINEAMHFIKSLPCHVVIIAHSNTYEKYKGKGKAREVVSQRIQPLSYSGPQGEQLAKDFSDILYFFVNRQSQLAMTTATAHGRDGGSRVLEPATHLFTEFSWEKLIAASKGIYRLPENPSEVFDSPGFEILPPGKLPKHLANIGGVGVSVNSGIATKSPTTLFTKK